jgi:hypothetical protein
MGVAAPPVTDRRLRPSQLAAEAMSPVQVGTAFVGAGWLAAFGVAGVFLSPRLFSSNSSASDTPVRCPASPDTAVRRSAVASPLLRSSFHFSCSHLTRPHGALVWVRYSATTPKTWMLMRDMS